jgi:hypothetical protein
MRIYVAVCVSFLFLFPGVATAARLRYEVHSQVRNKSQLAQFIFAEGNGVAQYYHRYKKIYCFANDEKTAAFIMDITRRVYAQIADDLGMESIKKDSLMFSIFILSEESWQAIGLDQRAGAFYMNGYNEIYVRLFTTDRTMIASNLAHELTHLVVDTIAPGAPLWFNEGIAQYEGDKVSGKNRQSETRFVSKNDLARVIKQGNFNLEKMHSMRTYPAGSGAKYVFYDMSAQLVTFIDARGSLPVFSRAILIEKIPFVSAIKKSISFQISSISHLEREFISFLS